jgi:hypothetical protein
MRARVLILVLAAFGVVAGSFGVAAAGERKQPVLMSDEDCGCTGAARAKDRIERGIIPTTPAEQSSQR